MWKETLDPTYDIKFRNYNLNWSNLELDRSWNKARWILSKQNASPIPKTIFQENHNLKTMLIQFHQIPTSVAYLDSLANSTTCSCLIRQVVQWGFEETKLGILKNFVQNCQPNQTLVQMLAIRRWCEAEEQSALDKLSLGGLKYSD